MVCTPGRTAAPDGVDTGRFLSTSSWREIADRREEGLFVLEPGPALEAWAVAHPLRVIGQVYLDSPGLPETYLSTYAGREFDGQTEGTYTDVVFPDGSDLIRHDEVVYPPGTSTPGGPGTAASARSSTSAPGPVDG
jgi:hypothetical protein